MFFHCLGHGVCKVTIEDFVCCGSGAGCHVTPRDAPEQQAIMLSAGGPGTGSCRTAMHKSHRKRNGGWPRRCDLVQHQMQGRAPRVLCVWRRTRSTRLAASMGRARARPHRAVQRTLRRLIEQAGGHADVERHVPELYDWAKNNNEAAPEMRCAILDVVSWFPTSCSTSGWTSACDARMQNFTTKVCRSQGWLQLVEKPKKKRYGTARETVGLRDLWKTGRRRNQVAA